MRCRGLKPCGNACTRVLFTFLKTPNLSRNKRKVNRRTPGTHQVHVQTTSERRVGKQRVRYQKRLVDDSRQPQEEVLRSGAFKDIAGDLKKCMLEFRSADVSDVCSENESGVRDRTVQPNAPVARTELQIAGNLQLDGIRPRRHLTAATRIVYAQNTRMAEIVEKWRTREAARSIGCNRRECLAKAFAPQNQTLNLATKLQNTGIREKEDMHHSHSSWRGNRIEEAEEVDLCVLAFCEFKRCSSG